MLAFPKLRQDQLYVVLTPDMDTSYPVGTLLVVEPIQADEVMQNDVITFASGSAATTKRVISVLKDQSRFITKGDSNPSIDPEPFAFESVLGRVRYGIPYLGLITTNISTPKGIMISAGALLVLVLLFVLPSFFEKEEQISVI